MNINTFDKIEAVEELWRKLYNENPMLSFFQSYEWNLNLQKKFYSRKVTRGLGNVITVAVIDSSFIAPLVVDKIHKSATLLGQAEASDYLSFVFGSSETKESLVEKIKYLMSTLQLKKFYISRINQSSVLRDVFDCLQHIDNCWHFDGKAECVSVNLSGITDSFYNSLSKSVRQNYRTGLNRLKADGKLLAVETSYEMLTAENAKKLLSIYKQRRKNCDSRKVKEKLIGMAVDFAKLVSLERYFDVLTGYGKEKPVFMAQALIDGKIAAFCIGDYNSDKKTMSISRVATSKDFYRYSVGMLMFVEILEKLKDDIDNFDLTRGNEDYKFKLGGKVHLNYSYYYKAE